MSLEIEKIKNIVDQVASSRFIVILKHLEDGVSPIIDDDGTIYVTADDGVLYAIGTQ